MSSIALVPSSTRIGGSGVRTARRMPRVRLTRRGRLVFFVTFLMVALVAMVAAAGIATATKDAGTPQRVHVIQVQAGDTLYGIAGNLAKPGKVRDMVDRIKELNSLPDSQLRVGQNLAVPVTP